MSSLLRSVHQQRVDAFMRLAQQEVPTYPIVLSEDVRLTRARLILEEALETINKGLGVDVRLVVGSDGGVHFEKCQFAVFRPFDLVETVDGCCDLNYVSTGTLSACGICDEPVQRAVDEHNLAKFGPGAYKDEHGKWIKPAGLQPPNIAGLIREQELEA